RPEFALCRFCNPALLKFRSIPKPKILEEIKFNLTSGIKKVFIHSDDFFRYGSKGHDPNPTAILDLLSCVKKMTCGLGKNSFDFDFISASSIMQAPDLIEDVSELMQLGKKNQSIVALGVETGSPRLLAKHMPGKVKPFKIEDWPEIIVSAAKILHDNNWIGFYSFILGLPEETSDDLMKTLELVDRLKSFNCVLMPIIFMPIAIGPATKVVGIGCLDPLAMSYGTKIAQCFLHCLHLSASDSIMAKTFREVLFNPIIRKFRSNGLKVIIGGQG
ncbi:unnamed protein product, partial [marine sediment metagenome]